MDFSYADSSYLIYDDAKSLKLNILFNFNQVIGHDRNTAKILCKLMGEWL